MWLLRCRVVSTDTICRYNAWILSLVVLCLNEILKNIIGLHSECILFTQSLSCCYELLIFSFSKDGRQFWAVGDSQCANGFASSAVICGLLLHKSPYWSDNNYDSTRNELKSEFALLSCYMWSRVTSRRARRYACHSESKDFLPWFSFQCVVRRN